jgi:hypothetical protein
MLDVTNEVGIGIVWLDWNGGTPKCMHWIGVEFDHLQLSCEGDWLKSPGNSSGICGRVSCPRSEVEDELNKRSLRNSVPLEELPTASVGNVEEAPSQLESPGCNPKLDKGHSLLLEEKSNLSDKSFFNCWLEPCPTGV